MIREIALQYARKGGPGSGFSDPNCRRGIPGQRGGSVNICQPGGLARAIALGVDVSDVNIKPQDLTNDVVSTPGVDKLDHIRKVVRERIDEPNKVTRREIISQQLSLPYNPHERDNVYRDWLADPRQAPDLWNAATHIEGIHPNDINSYRMPLDTGQMDNIDFARSVAADVQLSRDVWDPQTLVWRGLKRKDNNSDWMDAVKYAQDVNPDGKLYVPNSFLESWTTDYNQAENFATSNGDGGVVVEQKFQPDSIFLNHYAIPALEPEQEVIALSRSPFDAIDVKDFTVL